MQLSPLLWGGCTGNYDLRLTIGRNARISSPSHLIMDKCQTGFGLLLGRQSTSVLTSELICRTFSWSKSRASWSPTAFISVLCRADVTYMCMSRNLDRNKEFFFFVLHCLFFDLLIAPPCSACSISSWERSLTNHSKLFWSRLIQKKSTYAGREFKCTLWLCSHLSQVEHCGRDVVAPLVLAFRALLLHLPVPGEKGVRHMGWRASFCQGHPALRSDPSIILTQAPM